MKVTLREKRLKDNRRRLYLDFYPPIIKPDTGKPTRREFLSLYLLEKPRNEHERPHNKETLLLAENIRAKRQLEIQAGNYGFLVKAQRTADFLSYFRKIAEKHYTSKSARQTWENAYLHFADFCEHICTFERVNKSLVEDFREYLLRCESRRSNKRTLSQNTAATYFERFLSVVKSAVEDKLLLENPAQKVPGIKTKQATREYLTIEELQLLAKTESRMPDSLRRACLFSALTGLRFSDIAALEWGNVRHSTASGHYLEFKMSVLIVAGSVAGGGSENGFLRRWNTTGNALEDIAVMHNHGLLCLDELQQVEPRPAGEIAYLLANGQGKARMQKTTALHQITEWNLIFLSSGEISLADHVAQAGLRARGGQDVRMVDIDADAGKFGLFDDLHGFQNASEFANELRKASETYYGTALRAFLAEIVTQQNELPEAWQNYAKNFKETALPKNASGEVSRVCRRFALVAFAGERAQPITKWKKGDVTDAAQRIFQRWLEVRGANASSDAERAIRQVRRFLEAHAESRFQKITEYPEDDTSAVVRDRAGFIRADRSEFWILPETFRSEVCKGFDALIVAKELEKAGFLRKGGDKFTCPQRIRAINPKQPTRVYVVTNKIFEGSETETEAEKDDDAEF